MDPIGNFSCELETQVRYAVENEDCLSAITTHCKVKPKSPGKIQIDRYFALHHMHFIECTLLNVMECNYNAL